MARSWRQSRHSQSGRWASPSREIASAGSDAGLSDVTVVRYEVGNPSVARSQCDTSSRVPSWCWRGPLNGANSHGPTKCRPQSFTATFVRSYAQEFENLDRLRQQVEAGKITLLVAEIYPPEGAADAHRRLEAGGTRGRLVIQF